MAVLRSPYLAANARLREAASGGRPLVQGETSVGVAQLQAALSDLGYSLPRSIGPLQAVDGFFGAETVTAVTAFQKDRKLAPTGSADAQSLAAADAALATALPLMPQPRRHRAASTVGKAQPVGRRAPPIAQPASFGIYFEDPNYMTGVGDPTIAPDGGAGVWNSRRRTFSAVALRAAIVTGLGPVTDAAIGRNATRHMRHYFDNTGLDLAIDLENMVRIVPSARQALVLEFRQVQRFLKDLPIGRYDFTSRVEQGGYNQQGENTDWYFAIGGYALWGKAARRSPARARSAGTTSTSPTRWRTATTGTAARRSRSAASPSPTSSWASSIGKDSPGNTTATDLSSGGSPGWARSQCRRTT